MNELKSSFIAVIVFLGMFMFSFSVMAGDGPFGIGYTLTKDGNNQVSLALQDPTLPGVTLTESGAVTTASSEDPNTGSTTYYNAVKIECFYQSNQVTPAISETVQPGDTQMTICNGNPNQDEYITKIVFTYVPVTGTNTTTSKINGSYFIDTYQTTAPLSSLTPAIAPVKSAGANSSKSVVTPKVVVTKKHVAL